MAPTGENADCKSCIPDVFVGTFDFFVRLQRHVRVSLARAEKTCFIVRVATTMLRLLAQVT